MDEQKTIEYKINNALSGESLNNALDLIGFLRTNNLSLEFNNDGEGWAVGGIVGNSIGYMLVNGKENMPGPWTIWFNSCDFNYTDDEDLKETAWTHASPCGKCHSGWKDCGNGDRMIFDKEFKSLCHSPLMFTNPDAKTLINLKKLILMVK